jgi:hypothetical protein
VQQAAPLHSRVGALVQILRFAGGSDGVALPPLPPAETALLVAAEANVDVATSRAWREIHVELEAEGVQPVETDVYRLVERRHAGGARIDGVWAAQEYIYEMGTAEEKTREGGFYQKAATVRRDDPMKQMLAASAMQSSKKSFEMKRRGQIEMKRMLERTRTPWVADKEALAEARATERALHAPSRLEARAAAWIFDASGKDLNKAATKLQAAQRGKQARRELRVRSPKRSPKSRGGSPTLLESSNAYQAVVPSKAAATPGSRGVSSARAGTPAAAATPANGKSRPRTAHQ